jgi:hypothetical protein
MRIIGLVRLAVSIATARREQYWGVTGVTRVTTKQSCRQTLDGLFRSRALERGSAATGSRRERSAQLQYIYIYILCAPVGLACTRLVGNGKPSETIWMW